MRNYCLLVMALAGVAAAFPAGAGFLPVGTEVAELRDEVSRHYSNGNGTITAVISAGPIHVQDAAGNWVRPEELDYEVSLPTFEYEYATGHASTDGTQYGKTGNGLMKVEREVTPYPPSTIERAGWAKFSLASLPEWARITGAAFYRVITYFELHMGLSYRTLNLDPVTAGAQTLYQTLYNGTVCYDGERGRLYDTVDLGSVGVQHVQQSLSRKWVAFGVVGTGYSSIMTKRVWIIGWDNQPRSSAPWLLVTYEPPTAVEEPVSALGLRSLSVTPNPVTEGFATLRVQGFPDSGVRAAKVRVFDPSGRCVIVKSLGQSTKGQAHDFTLDLRSLSAGVYLVQLDAPGQKLTGKITVEK